VTDRRARIVISLSLVAVAAWFLFLDGTTAAPLAVAAVVVAAWVAWPAVRT
jgi:hypothetical protein